MTQEHSIAAGRARNCGESGSASPCSRARHVDSRQDGRAADERTHTQRKYLDPHSNRVTPCEMGCCRRLEWTSDPPADGPSEYQGLASFTRSHQVMAGSAAGADVPGLQHTARPDCAT